MSVLTNGLWMEYRGNGSHDARARLLEEYLGLVYHAARQLTRWRSSAPDFEDLVSAGTVGLVQALEGFEPARGLAFSTYAMPRIRGAIVDELHAQSWAPRSVRTRRRRMALVQEELQQRLGRAPKAEQMAEALEVDLATYWRWSREADERVMLGLDHGLRSRGEEQEPNLSETIPDARIDPPETALAQQETLRVLRDALVGLPERDRLVLTLYYFEGLALREIGEVLQVTESRVSQIHRKALRHLRTQLELDERP